MKGVDTLGLAPHFDGMGYPRWKVLMEAYLQANDLNVWRVTNERVKMVLRMKSNLMLSVRNVVPTLTNNKR
jgi:hypothetical protein